MSKEYYFISDLHLGAGEFKKTCAFENELIHFLQIISKKKDAELIIVGDMFGFWELNRNVEEDKLNYIINVHKNLFEQFKRTGKNIKITVISGNHDYELAYNIQYQKILKKYNIEVCKDQHMIKKINGKKIWIEHGHQQDEYNKISEWGDDKIKPFSYYLTKELMYDLHQKKNNKKDWVLDIQSVQPREWIPNWFFSNYFYNELNPILRYVALPFLLFFSFSFLVLLAGYLKKFNLITIPFLTEHFSTKFGLVGNALDIIIFVDTLVIIVLLIILLPILLIYLDSKRKFRNLGFSAENLKQVKKEKYLAYAKEVFEKNKNVKIFIFGHIHTAFMKKIGNNLVVNTGTWIKKLKRIKPLKLFILPSVYYPHYKLTIMHIYAEKNKIIVSHKHIDKHIKPPFTWLQKFAIFFVPYRRKKQENQLSIDL
ncbi:MAG: metallophosphoesterase [Candidatus Nanoarchaeia archaeon]|nr:metallophosphoesterase [Candidatus Nanoarchaeia archaeon]